MSTEMSDIEFIHKLPKVVSIIFSALKTFPHSCLGDNRQIFGDAHVNKLLLAAPVCGHFPRQCI